MCCYLKRYHTGSKVVTGTLENIVELSKELPTPALIVVGEVVKLREQLEWFR